MRASGQFATRETRFDLDRVLSAINEQYRDKLKRSDTAYAGKHICERKSVTEHHTAIEVHDTALLEKFKTFLAGKCITSEFKSVDGVHLITVNQDNMNAAKLTYRDEQEFLFSVNKMFKKDVAQTETTRPGGPR
jgi:hypothetical protein